MRRRLHRSVIHVLGLVTFAYVQCFFIIDTPYWTDVPFHFIDDPAVADQKKRKLKQRPSTGHRKRTRVDDRKQEREDSEGRAENDQIVISSDSDSDFTSS